MYFELPTALLGDVADLSPDERPGALLAFGVPHDRIAAMTEYVSLVNDMADGVDVDCDYALATIEAAERSLETFDEDFDEVLRRMADAQFELHRLKAEWHQRMERLREGCSQW